MMATYPKLLENVKDKLISWLSRILSKNYFIAQTPPTKNLFDERVKYDPNYNQVVSRIKQDQQFPFLDSPFTIHHNTTQHSKALILGEYGVAMINGKVILSTLLDSKGYLSKSGLLKYILFPWKRKGRWLSGTYYHLCGNMTYNYFHFLIDSLPRILDYLELKKEHKQLKLLINFPKKFTLEHLEICGVKPEDIFILEENLCLEKLIISNNKFTRYEISNFWGHHIYSRHYLSNLAHLGHQKASIQDQKKTRIYISRDDTGKRTITNEIEVVNFLSGYDFQKVTLDGLSVSEQIKLFAHSELIITPHGAGISNIIYSKNAVLIELFPRNRHLITLTHMFQIAQIGSNRHILVKVDDVDEHQNITISTEKLKPIIETFVNKQL